MKTYTLKNIPLGVLLISAFNIFGALVLLISIFTNPTGVSQAIATAHGFSSNMGVEILVVISAMAFVVAYGLISLSRWGFFLAIVYSFFLAGVSLFQGGLRLLCTGQEEVRGFVGNLLWSLLVVIYLIIARSSFINPQHSESHR